MNAHTKVVYMVVKPQCMVVKPQYIHIYIWKLHIKLKEVQIEAIHTIKSTNSAKFEAIHTIKLHIQQTIKPYTTDMLINTLFINLTTSKCGIEAS